MMWLILGMFAVVILAWIVLHALAMRSMAKSFGAPTPETAKIDAEAQDEKQKVEHASGQDLADQFSDRMLK